MPDGACEPERSREVENTDETKICRPWIRRFAWRARRSIGRRLAAGAAQSQEGPKSAYYVTSGNNGVNWILRHSKATPFEQVHWFISGGYTFGEHAIVVDKTVRTLGNNYASAGLPPSDGAE